MVSACCSLAYLRSSRRTAVALAPHPRQSRSSHAIRLPSQASFVWLIDPVAPCGLRRDPDLFPSRSERRTYLVATGPLRAECCVHPLTSHLISPDSHTCTVGRYRLSPVTRQTDCGRFAASLSICSGHGSGTHDRVFRFTPLFPTPQAAAQYALAQGMGYLQQPALPA